MTEQSQLHHGKIAETDSSLSHNDAEESWVGNPEPQERLQPALAGLCVLVADDESSFRRSVSDMLSTSGCQIDVACDGAEACRLVAGKRYDLVISDVTMPGATGYDVFAAAKAAHRDTGVILMTAFGYDPNHSVVKANQEGLTDVLVKPFEATALLARCHDALADE